MMLLSSLLRLRAFSLVESAIVLGVAGVVIGGIWVAASNVQETRKVQQTVSGIGLLVNRLQKAYEGTAISNVKAGPFDANFFLPFPEGFSKRTTGGCCTSNDLVDPFGRVTYLAIPVLAWTGNMPVLDFHFYGITKSRCVQLATGFAPILGLKDITNKPSSGANAVANPPITFAKANTICNAYSNVNEFIASFHIYP